MVFGGQKRERHEPADILLGKTFERSLSICGKNFHPVANRLQAALYREVVYLIGQGVLRVADADDAVSWGPGLRWGMGPSCCGASEVTQDFMEHLMGPMAGLMKILGIQTSRPT